MPAMSPVLPRPGIAIAAVFHLMTQYTRTRCPFVARSVCWHLEHLSGHPDIDPAVRQVALGALAAWEGMSRAPDAPPAAIH